MLEYRITLLASHVTVLCETSRDPLASIKESSYELSFPLCVQIKRHKLAYNH
jgi:hypothetical protein